MAFCGLQRLDDGVAGEFAVPFPADAVITTPETQETVLQVVDGQVPVLWQQLEMRQLIDTGHTFVEHGNVHHQCRKPDPGGWPCMDLVVKVGTHAGIRRQQLGWMLQRLWTGFIGLHGQILRELGGGCGTASSAKQLRQGVRIGT